MTVKDQPWPFPGKKTPEPNAATELKAALDQLAIAGTHVRELEKQRDQLAAALRVVLDQVDYTSGACGFAEMVGACLDAKVIDAARKALS